jgi:hypothetical protein
MLRNIMADSGRFMTQHIRLITKTGPLSGPWDFGPKNGFGQPGFLPSIASSAASQSSRLASGFLPQHFLTT